MDRFGSLRTLTACWLLLAAFAGCRMPPFSPHRLENTPGEVRRFLRRMGRLPHKPANATGRPLAVLWLRNPDALAAVGLPEGRVLWRQAETDLRTKVHVGRSNVYYVAGRGRDVRLVARGVRDGRIRWRAKLQVARDQAVYGLAADGDRVYVVVGSTGAFVPGKWRSYVEAWDGRKGKRRWRRTAPGRLGAPAAARGHVFLPYRQQYLSVLDWGKGREVLRVRARKQFITFVRATPEGIFFGGEGGAFVLNARAASGLRERADFLTLNLGRTGLKMLGGGRGMRLAYYWDGYEPVMASYTAYDRNRLLWRADSRARFLGRRAVLEYFRYFFGLDTEEGKLAWVHVESARDVASAAHVGSAILYVTSDGKFVALDPERGDRLWVARVGLKDIAGATFDAEGFRPPEGHRTAALPLTEALKRVVFDEDRRLAVAKLFAIGQLRGLKGAAVTRVLLRVLQDRKLPMSARLRAEQVLAERVSPESVPLLMKVLRVHFDYIEGTRPLAVGPVALALAKMRVRKAVPLLVEHLQDPNAPLSVVRSLVRALAQIGGPQVVSAFRQFLLDYRAAPEMEHAIRVLNEIARYLYESKGAAERQLLVFVGEDEHSLPALRAYVRKLLGAGSRGRPGPAR